MQPPSLPNQGWGNFNRFPVDYDPKIHGPYDPGAFYGKRDKAFGEVKLGEMGQWLGRRRMGWVPFTQLCSRAYWRWQHKYVLPRNTGIAPFFQVTVAACIFFYVINYPKLRHHNYFKYH